MQRFGASSPISFSERRGQNQGQWEEASGGRGALSNQLLAQVSRIFDFPRLCVSPKQNMQGYGALRFHLILSSPPFSEEGRRHKVSGQTVLLPQTQVGLGTIGSGPTSEPEGEDTRPLDSVKMCLNPANANSREGPQETKFMVF